jgi:hypothetical protein
MGMYLEAKHLDDLLSFGWDIIVENTSNPPGTVLFPAGETIAPKDVMDITKINSPRGMIALREFLRSGALTLINENSWQHEEFDIKNRRREAIMAQRKRNGNR